MNLWSSCGVHEKNVQTIIPATFTGVEGYCFPVTAGFFHVLNDVKVMQQFRHSIGWEHSINFVTFIV